MEVDAALGCHIADIGLVGATASVAVVVEVPLQPLKNRRMHFDVVVIAANFVIEFLNSTAGFPIKESEASLLNHFFAIQPVLWSYLYSMELLHECVFGSDLSISEVYNPAD